MPAMNDLKDVLANRDWVRRESPFSHVVASDVFTRSSYADLSPQLLAKLGGGPEKSMLPRTMPDIDVYEVAFDPSRAVLSRSLFRRLGAT